MMSPVVPGVGTITGFKSFWVPACSVAGPVKDQLIFVEKRINLKPYFQNISEEIKLENQKIKISYNNWECNVNCKNKLKYWNQTIS